MLQPYFTTIKKVLCLLSMMTFCMVCFGGIARSESSFQSATKTEVISVPDGQILHTIVTTPINTKYVSSGQVITLVLGSGFCYNSRIIAPINSMIYGSVIRVSSGKNGKPAELLLRFNQLITPYGLQIPISAIIKTSDKTGKIMAKEFPSTDGNLDIDIPIAAKLDLILTQPITVNPELYNSNY